MTSRKDSDMFRKIFPRDNGYKLCNVNHLGSMWILTASVVKDSRIHRHTLYMHV